MYFKWIFGVIGLFFGLQGAWFGFILGWLIDSIFGKKTKQEARNGAGDGNNFISSLLTLTAAVMRANGRIERHELDYVRNFFLQQFGREATRQSLLALRDMLKQPISINAACIRLIQQTDYNTRVQLLHYLFGIAYANAGTVNVAELNVIEQIAANLHITSVDFANVKANYTYHRSSYSNRSSSGGSYNHNNTYNSGYNYNSDWAYKTLEIDAKATDDEVKKAYRKMAVKCHPDKVSHLGEKLQKQAEEQFKKINAAFEEIKKQRGFA